MLKPKVGVGGVSSVLTVDSGTFEFPIADKKAFVKFKKQYDKMNGKGHCYIATTKNGKTKVKQIY